MSSTPPNLDHLLNTPFESWTYPGLKLYAVSANSSGRVNSAIIKLSGHKYYLTRSYRPNGSCYFNISPF